MRSNQNVHLFEILGDPHAEERVWLAAAQAIKSAGPQCQRSIARNVLTLFGAGVLAFGGCVLVKIGYDWGYRVVEMMLGQPSGQATNQGLTAIASLSLGAFPLFLGCFLSLAQECLGKSKLWRVGLVLMVLTETVWLSQQGSSDLYGLTVSLMASLFVGIVSFGFGQRLLRFYRRLKGSGLVPFELNQMVRNSWLYLVPCSFWGLAVLFNVWSWDVPLPLEIVSYALLLGLVGWTSSKRAENINQAVVAASLTAAPILVWAVVNLAGTIVSGTLDCCHLGLDLGWRSAVSALLILVGSALAVTLGATTKVILKVSR